MARTGNADRQRHWRDAIERQVASGQSIVGFCARKGFPQHHSMRGSDDSGGTRRDPAKSGRRDPCSRADSP